MQAHVCIHHYSAAHWLCIQAGFFPQASASSVHLDMKGKKKTEICISDPFKFKKGNNCPVCESMQLHYEGLFDN